MTAIATEAGLPCSPATDHHRVKAAQAAEQVLATLTHLSREPRKSGQPEPRYTSCNKTHATRTTAAKHYCPSEIWPADLCTLNYVIHPKPS